MKLNQYYAKDLNSEKKLIDQKAHGSLKKQHKDKTFLYLFSISVSKFFLMINFLLINVMCFNLLMYMVKNFKIMFLTAAEKQPIVFESDRTVKKLI